MSMTKKERDQQKKTKNRQTIVNKTHNKKLET